MDKTTPYKPTMEELALVKQGIKVAKRDILTKMVESHKYILSQRGEEGEEHTLRAKELVKLQMAKLVKAFK